MAADLLPVALLVLIPLVMVMLGRCRVVAVIPTTEVDVSFSVTTEVALDHFLADGVLRGKV